jgi:hypothetical protein
METKDSRDIDITRLTMDTTHGPVVVTFPKNIPDRERKLSASWMRGVVKMIAEEEKN